MALQYVAYDWLGRRVKGVLETDSEQDAYATLQEDGLIPYRLRPVRPRRSLVQLMPILFRPGRQELIDFTRETASLINSGIPLRQALVAVRDGPRSVGFKEALRRVIEEIEAGNRFSGACAQIPAVFPDFYVRLLRVAEAGGSLGLTLRNLAETLAKEKRVRDRVRRALVYPGFTLMVAVVAGVVLMTYALPALLGFLEEFGGEDLPTATRLLIQFREFVMDYGTFVVISVVASVTLGFALMRTRTGRRMRDRVLLKTPVIGRTLLLSNTFSITSTMAALLGSGIAPIEALRLTRQSVNNTIILEALTEAEKAASAGERLAVAFQQQRVFPPLLSQAIGTGEVGGNLRENLSGLADYYEHETDRAVGAATELVQPVVVLLVAGVVGFVAVGIISGIYSSIAAVG